MVDACEREFYNKHVLIDGIGFYAVLAIFQPFYVGINCKKKIRWIMLAWEFCINIYRAAGGWWLCECAVLNM